jgi:ATP-dependent helicase/DNAse subunit B
MLETEMVQPLIVSGFTVNIRGKVDRVEEKNGIINIADYKTGSDSGNKLNVDDLKQLPDTPKFSKAMQLLMYAWMYWSANGKQEVNLRSGIYWLRNSSKGFDTLEVDGNDVITKSILESFENVLCAVIEKLLSPDIPFTKTEDIKRCTYCEFAKICSREKPDSNF